MLDQTLPLLRFTCEDGFFLSYYIFHIALLLLFSWLPYFLRSVDEDSLYASRTHFYGQIARKHDDY